MAAQSPSSFTCQGRLLTCQLLPPIASPERDLSPKVFDGPNFVSRSVWIGSFPDYILPSEQELETLFSRFGSVVGAFVPKRREDPSQ